ncbi:MAG: hypothetical protein E6H61_06830 [Betaproteobacteria bacterium]|nr:MAG: hypothetical protein E6H61_06830 [Betaproteobacteria bacterium]
MSSRTLIAEAIAPLTGSPQVTAILPGWMSMIPVVHQSETSVSSSSAVFAVIAFQGAAIAASSASSAGS